jgi:membrane protein
MEALPVRELWIAFRRGVRVAFGATVRGFVEFYNSSNLTFASSIAYYSLLSFFPFVVLVLALLSRSAVAQAGSEERVVDLLERALPSEFAFLSDQVIALQRAPIPLTIAGTVLTVWAAMGVFGAITSAVNHAWGTERPYNFFKHKLVAFLMMIAAGLMFAGTLFMMSAGRASEETWFTGVTRWLPWMEWIAAKATRYAFFVASTIGVGLIYFFLPNTKVRLRDVWFGAVLAALLWQGALLGFAWYMRAFTRFGVHGSVGTVVAFLVWVYVSAIILLYGVEVTAVYARLRRKAELDPTGDT